MLDSGCWMLDEYFIKLIGLIEFIGLIKLIEFLSSTFGIQYFFASRPSIPQSAIGPFPLPTSNHPTFAPSHLLFFPPSHLLIFPPSFFSDFQSFPLPHSSHSHLLIFPPSCPYHLSSVICPLSSAIRPLSSDNECRRQKNFTLIRNRSHDMSRQVIQRILQH